MSIQNCTISGKNTSGGSCVYIGKIDRRKPKKKFMNNTVYYVVLKNCNFSHIPCTFVPPSKDTL